MKSPRKSKQQIHPWDCEGLRISVRGATFHATGTLRVGKRSVRVRQTLGVDAVSENIGEAEREARKIVGQIRSQLGGATVHKAVATLVAERFKSHIGPSDRRILEDLTREFKTQILWDIPPEKIVAFVNRRQSGNKAETRERYISTICAFLVLKISEGQYACLPVFVRDQKARNPTRRSRRPVKQFRPELLVAIIDAAHPSIAIQLCVEWICGARVSSVLQGCALEDLSLETMTLIFRDTKNGEDVPVAVPASMRGIFKNYLDWRELQVQGGTVGAGSKEPLFLHHRGKPYKPNFGRWGTQNKTGFNAAKRRALAAIEAGYDAQIAEMTAAGDKAAAGRLLRQKADDMGLLKEFTQHWLRHLFATAVGRLDPKSAMKQGGWLDIRSLNGYMIEDAEYQRALVEERGLPGTKLTQAAFQKQAN